MYDDPSDSSDIILGIDHCHYNTPHGELTSLYNVEVLEGVADREDQTCAGPYQVCPNMTICLPKHCWGLQPHKMLHVQG